MSQEEPLDMQVAQRAQPKKQMAPACDWVFTLNNPTEEDHAAVWAMDYKYIIFSIERGAEDGTLHFQGFVQFREKLRLTALKKLLRRAHWEKRRGTPYEAQHYVMKPVPDCECEHCVEERLNPTHVEGPFEDGFLSAEQQYKVHEVNWCLDVQPYCERLHRRRYAHGNSIWERHSKFLSYPRCLCSFRI